jgi:hypothetical protein
LIFDPVRHAHPRQKFRQDGCGKSGLALIEIAGQQINRQKATPFQLVKHRKQGIAILAARQAHQPFRRGPVAAAFDHPVLLDRFARMAHDPFAELLELRRGRRALEQRVYFGFIQHSRAMPDCSIAA